MFKGSRNPSPPGEDFNYEVCDFFSYTPQKVFTFAPFKSYLEFLHESLVTTPTNTDAEEEVPSACVESQVSSTKVASPIKEQEVLKQLDLEVNSTKTISIKSSDKEEEITKSHFRKHRIARGSRRLIDYSDSEIELSSGEILDSSSSDERSRPIKRKRHKSSSKLERRRKDHGNICFAGRKQESVQDDRKRRHDRRPGVIKKEFFSEESSADERPKNYRSPEKSCRRRSEKPVRRSPVRLIHRNPERSIRRSSERSIRRSPERIIRRSAERFIGRSSERFIRRSPEKLIPRNLERFIPRSPDILIRRIPKKPVRRIPEKPVHRSPERIVCRSPDRPVRRSPERSFRRSPERSFRRSPERSFRRSPKRSIRRSPEILIRRIPDRPVHRSPEKPVQMSPEKPVQRSPERPVQRSPEKPVHKSPEKPVHKSPEKPVHRSPEKPVHKSPEKAVHKSPEKPVHKSPEKTVHKSPEKLVHTAPEKPVHTEPEKSVCIAPEKPVHMSPEKPPLHTAPEKPVHEIPESPIRLSRSPSIEIESGSDVPKKVYIKRETIDSKDAVFCGPEDFYCKVCQLSLNSELTYDSHIRGKKHQKAINALSVHEVARGSIAVPAPPPINEEAPRFAGPPIGRKRIPVADISKIQTVCDSYRNSPVPGLGHVLEIRQDKETSYYCELCDAPCAPITIMPHLTGFKHQLRFLKEIHPTYYNRNKDLQKGKIERAVIKLLYEHERHFGREIIQVFEDIPDPRAGPVAPGPSWRVPIPYYVKQEQFDGESAAQTNDEFLDTSKADFYCKVCDSHMNNLNMWEAHIRGKRHLKNTKKVPGESKCKAKTHKAPPGTRSHLERELFENDPDDLVVGLDYIRETQVVNGDFYNCFLCGSCSTNRDILDHILSLKHKTKYLEKLSADGVENAICTISGIEIRQDFRETLVQDECNTMLARFGSGTPEVYISKNNIGSSGTW